MSNLLMLSNSTLPGTPFFTWPKPWVKDFLSPSIKEILFIPFAAVTFSFDEYSQKIKEVFNALGFKVVSIHEADDKLKAVQESQAIVVGGGNTFALLSRMYAENLIEPVRSKVISGTPYIGWSAGANLACPTIMTTNDMPVIEPPFFAALNLIPFQINPHYHELKFENQGGETRKERLEEFLVMNPDKKVVGLPEGMLLQQNDNKLFIRGTGMAKLYSAGNAIKDLLPDQDLSFLL